MSIQRYWIDSTDSIKVVWCSLFACFPGVKMRRRRGGGGGGEKSTLGQFSFDITIRYRKNIFLVYISFSDLTNR